MTSTSPPSVGTSTVAEVLAEETSRASPVTRSAGTCAGSVDARDRSSSGLAHRSMAAYQASLLAPSLDHARTKAEATAVADCFVTGPEAVGADVEAVVVAGVGDGEADIVCWLEALVGGAGGAAAGRVDAWPSVARPTTASSVSMSTAVMLRFRHDHSGHRRARPSSPLIAGCPPPQLAER
ncbi:hypothetical protein ACFP55_00645 [Knoellia sp. GCM10027112]